MPKQRSLDERLAEAQAKRQQIDERLKKLEVQRKSLDQRKRFRGEKAILQLVLAQAQRSAEFRAEMIAELAAATLKPEDRDAALWLLAVGQPNIDARAENLLMGEVAEPGHPKEQAA